MKIEGTVERFACHSFGHGFTILLVGSSTLYHFGKVGEAYSSLDGRPSSSNSTLAELTCPGDKISFTLAHSGTYFAKAQPGTLRNWTLEHRLHGEIKDISPLSDVIAYSPPALPAES